MWMKEESKGNTSYLTSQTRPDQTNARHLPKDQNGQNNKVNIDWNRFKTFLPTHPLDVLISGASKQPGKISN